jgi:hypothetical protein
MPWSSEWSLSFGLSNQTFLSSPMHATCPAHLIRGVLISIHPMALQPELGLGLLCWGSLTIMFYGVRLLASWPTPVNFVGPMIFCWGLLPEPKVPVLRRWKPVLHPTLICCTTHCALPLDHHEEVESMGLLAEPAGWIHRKLSGI